LSETGDVARCQWHEPGGLDAAETIATFLASIGIRVEIGPIEEATFLPGLRIDHGTIRVDPAVQAWPGDLLHEAGHVAVTEPERRPVLDQPSADGGEEMAAIAWSVAAARACGIGLDVLFHAQGYKGDALWLHAEFSKGNPFGVPLLAWYGLTSEAGFPTMNRWLR
jgi:hypothetical protein